MPPACFFLPRRKLCITKLVIQSCLPSAACLPGIEKGLNERLLGFLAVPQVQLTRHTTQLQSQVATSGVAATQGQQLLPGWMFGKSQT